MSLAGEGALRHTVLLTFTEGTSPELIDGIVARLRALPTLVETLDAIEIERDLAIDRRSAHVLIRADFASVADWQAYQDHPAHVAVIRELIAPVLAGRAAVQHAIAPGTRPLHTDA
jgi:hypothetical protein